MKEWRKIHPLTALQKKKDIARSYAGVYLRKGFIKKADCVECGSPESEMHHPDYDKPIEIVWLCREHHVELHRAESDRRNNLQFKGVKPSHEGIDKHQESMKSIDIKAYVCYNHNQNRFMTDHRFSINN
jgi:hypothetical protein